MVLRGSTFIVIGGFAIGLLEAEPRLPEPIRKTISGWPTTIYIAVAFGLIGYGLFRFGHEFLRATPRIGIGFTGYHLAALAVVVLGILGFVRRRGLRRASRVV